MRIITYNVNGIRSAMRKGFMDWLSTDPADIICLQEIKANQDDVDHELINRLGYNHYWYSAKKRGYSGVSVLTKIPPQRVYYGSGQMQSDTEGRIIRLDFPAFTLINAYFPSGSSGDTRQQYKYQWLNEFRDYLAELRDQGLKLVVCGDYNICHKPIDIHNPVSNKNSSGFLPEERAWMDRFFESGFIDTFRHYHSDPHHYSWWSFRANSRERNKGWRIDYINVSADLKDALSSASILPHIKHSDHCPVYLEIML